jgi:hypothetical protein
MTENKNRNTTGKWAIALVGWWNWKAPGSEEYGAVGMGEGMAHAKLVGRYASRAEAEAALEAIERQEEAENRPWRGRRGDYEVRPFRMGDYMAPQDYDAFGPVAGLVKWA